MTYSFVNKRLFEGFLLSILISEVFLFYLSIPQALAIAIILSVSIIWLDGFSTYLGLRLGLEESNIIIRNLQKKFGWSNGLIVSRIFPISLVICSSVIIGAESILLIISSIFMVCHSRNLLNIFKTHFKNNLQYL